MALCELQYLKQVRPIRDVPIFERFPVLICVAIIWIYSLILTASGAYRDKPNSTQLSCRTDRANLISTAPWYVKISTSASLDLCSVFTGSDINVLLFRFKFPYPLQWGPPTFSAGHSFAMMSAVLVSMVEVHLIDDKFYLKFKLTSLLRIISGLMKLLLNVTYHAIVDRSIQGSISIGYCNSTSSLCIKPWDWLAGGQV